VPAWWARKPENGEDASGVMATIKVQETMPDHICEAIGPSVPKVLVVNLLVLKANGELLKKAGHELTRPPLTGEIRAKKRGLAKATPPTMLESVMKIFGAQAAITMAEIQKTTATTTPGVKEEGDDPKQTKPRVLGKKGGNNNSVHLLT
jgi:hypothetical protein